MARTVDELVAKFSLKTNFAKEVGSSVKEIRSLRSTMRRLEPATEKLARDQMTLNKLYKAGKIDVRDYREQMKRLNTEMKRQRGGSGRLGRLAGGVRGGLAAAGIGLSIGGAASFVNTEINRTVKQADTADKLGITIRQLLTLTTAAERTGVSASTLETSLQRLGRRTSDAAQGSGEAVKAFEELNLNAKEMNRLSPAEQFEAVRVAMANVTNQNDKLRIAMKLFDTEGVALVNTLGLAEGEFAAINSEVGDLAKAREDNTEAARNFQVQISALNIEMQEMATKTLPALVEFIKLINSAGQGRRNILNLLDPSAPKPEFISFDQTFIDAPE